MPLRNQGRLTGRFDPRGSIRSTKIDRLFDNVIEWRVLSRQGHPQFQFGALDLSFANNALNFPLRGDADRLEELTHSHVEPILVHGGLQKPGSLYSIGRVFDSCNRHQ